MRTVLALLLPLLGACGTVAEPPQIASAASTKRSGDSRPPVINLTRPRGGLTIANIPPPEGMTGGEYHCDGDKHDSTKNYPKCQVPIPVIILFGKDKDKNDVCFSLLPYNTLVVHTGAEPAKKEKVQIVWEIHGPAGYEFALADGAGSPVHGVRIKKPKSEAHEKNPDEVYDFSKAKAHKATPGQRASFEHWVLASALEKLEFDQEAIIKGPKPKEFCVPLDPLIVNQDN